MNQVPILNLRTADRTWRANLLAGDSPTAVAGLLERLPLDLPVVQESWSRDVFVGTAPVALPVGPGDERAPYQYPGLLMYDPKYDRLAVCYGDGRLQDGFAPIEAVALAAVAGDLRELEAFGRSLQFDGVQTLRLEVGDEPGPVPVSAPETGRRVTVSLGDAVATAVLLEERTPKTADLFASLLPLSGFGTNSISSGPFTRFWNEAGGPEGQTLLEVDEDESRQLIGGSTNRYFSPVVAAPGYLYYNQTPSYQGIRIAARAATIQRGMMGPSGKSKLVCFGQLIGDWSHFRAATESLVEVGARPMRFDLIKVT